MARRPGTPATCAARRTPKTLDTYVQVAIEANDPVNPVTAKKRRRRRKKNQRESSSQPLSVLHAEPKPATVPAPSMTAKPKRRKRKSKFKNYGSEDHIPLSFKFRVQGLVTPDELEDEDEVEDLQEELCGDFGRFGELEKLTIIQKGDRVNLLKGDVVVIFRESDNAVSAFNVYNGKMFGGKAVTCFWETQGVVVVKGMLSLEELENPDEMADIEEEMMQHFRKYGEVKELQLSEATAEITVSFVIQQYAEKAVHALNGSRYGGREVMACLQPSSEDTHIGTKSENSEIKRVATSTTQISASTEELQDLVELLIKRLATLQERAHKQSKATVLSRRLVLDFHGNEAIEDKYAELVVMATERDVPVLASMNRRKLGRILHKSILRKHKNSVGASL